MYLKKTGINLENLEKIKIKTSGNSEYSIK